MVLVRHAAMGAAVLLVVVQLMGGEAGAVAALLALPIAAMITFRMDWRYVPVLLVLALPSLGIATVGEEAVFSGLVFRDAVPAAFVGPLQLSVPLVAMSVGLVRVLLVFGRGRGNAIRPLFPTRLLLVFLVALLPALVGALQGQAMGLNRWSQGVRGMLAIGAAFWGALVAYRARASRERVLQQMVTVVVVASALLLTGLLRGHFLFLVVGLSAGCLPHLMRRRSPAALVAGATAVIAPVVTTLTVAAGAVFAWFALAISTDRVRFARRLLVRASVVGAMAASGGMIWMVLAMRYDVGFMDMDEQGGLLSYAMFKLLGDRGPLWLAAIAQITTGPLLVAPSGRPLLPENFRYLRGGLDVWESGAHNTVLELVRNTGLIAGGVGVFLMIYVLIRVSRVLTDSREPALRAFAAGTLGVAIAGITTGNYPIEDVGFFLWALAGWVLGLMARERLEGESNPAVESGEAVPPRSETGPAVGVA